jgi:hypothetical protein
MQPPQTRIKLIGVRLPGFITPVSSQHLNISPSTTTTIQESKRPSTDLKQSFLPAHFLS